MLRPLVLAAALAAALHVPAWAETTQPAVAQPQRFALVIGNAKYSTSPLTKSEADAEAMSQTLGQLGFQVTKVTNATLEDTTRAAIAVEQQLRTGDILAIYYTGASVEIDGRHHLIPVDFPANGDEITIRNRTTDLKELAARAGRGKATTLVFLDDCRNSPWTKGPVSNGLDLRMESPGSVFLYAAQPGTCAMEGASDQPLSLFTTHLLKALTQPGTEIGEALRPVVWGVAEQSQGRQIPVLEYSLTKPFYLSAAP